MEKLTITKVSRNDKTSQAGKSYVSLGIKCKEYNDVFLNGFGNKDNADWKVGDVVEVTVEKKEYNGKTYLNFSVPKKGEVNSDEIVEIRKKVNLTYHIAVQLYKHFLGTNEVIPNPEYPTNELPSEEVPF